MNEINFPVPEYMNSSCFWTDKLLNAEEIIMSVNDIKRFNIKITEKVPTVKNLEDISENISKEILTNYINSYKIPVKNMYSLKGELITKDFYDKLIFNRNIKSLQNSNKIKYGLTVKKVSLRSFPDETPIFSSLEHSEINNMDRFQQTGCFPFEPLIILHESTDSKWFFVETYNYRGWTKQENIAVAEDKKQVFDYANCEEFLMVIAKNIKLNTEEILCSMGTKIYLQKSTDNYQIKIPSRTKEGTIKFITTQLKKSPSIVEGYLPFTRLNIINQGLKFLDDKYDWGDRFTGKDCSSFILTIYKTFGFRIPRDADEQEQCSDYSLKFNNQDTLNSLELGDILFMEGHVMLYIGEYKGTHYMLHNFAYYSEKTNNTITIHPVYKVSITPVTLLNFEGIPFTNKFTSAIKLRK